MEDISKKVIKYEEFLNETLRADLARVHADREAIFEDLSEYLQLKNVIEKLKENKLEQEALKTRVDLGCNFYVQAKVPDTSRIYVQVGFGFYVEFTLDEALRFIERKERHLQTRADQLQEQVLRIKAHIKIVLEGLRELQHIDGRPQEPGYRDVLS